MTGAGRRRRRATEEHVNHERWLLTWADLLTLLLALFIVMYAASAVNTNKAKAITASLQEAFGGRVLTGGGSIRPEQRADEPVEAVARIAPLAPKVVAAEELPQADRAAAAGRAEESELQALKRRLDAVIAAKGLRANVRTAVERRGLVVRVITDQVLFASGSATLAPAGARLLDEIRNVLRVDREHPIVVDGHTDSQPIATGRFPDNWELSVARAASVVRFLAGSELQPSRFSATGHGDQMPVASDATPAGRQQNRRVEIALTRLHASS
jgi:chemotaxis protein MotB